MQRTDMQLEELLQTLAHLFEINLYPPDERGGIYHAAYPQPVVQRLGLALEPGPGLSDWLTAERPDALWLHRPWKLDLSTLPANETVLYHHLPFDEHLTLGYAQPLAEALGLAEVQPIGYKQAPGFPKRPIGMIGPGPALDFEGWCRHLTDVFGGYEEAKAGRHERIDRIAVMGAMNDELVGEAAERGASLYVTGQYRRAAQKAVDRTGMAVVAIGHQRSEEWGVRMLAEIVQNLGLAVSVYNDSGAI